ncbi:DUF305 domain-containing protein [Nocardia flavorosea]|uniref:DUF305 domain-containing protein n=1 Tax=Nocardia flavorosea TaxID=53429 RepID=A0A846YQ15_9NOCA|nr:DUF305 domain-containing protein [Nocardia flavorosea]NKY60853.1 DUF305 domain-containing protein [Nocardia flavorosea]
MPDTETVADETQPARGWRAQARAQRVPLLIIGAIALLVAGFGAGVLLAPDTTGDASPAGPADIGFAQDMSAHHAQAVEMSGIALNGSTDPDVRRLAFDILTTQQGQIGRMQGWLQMWDAPASTTGEPMTWMPQEEHGGHGHDHGGAGTAAMPGMATTDELRQLRAARGAQLDTLFLQLMLRHHQGGVPMLEYGAEHAETTEIKTLAGQMLPAQEGESRLMTKMLADRGARPLPFE